MHLRAWPQGDPQLDQGVQVSAADHLLVREPRVSVAVDAQVVVREVRGPGGPASDSHTYLQFVRRTLRAYSRRVVDGDTDDLRDLAGLAAEVDAMIRATIMGLREGPAQLTWAQIGDALGVSRQGAQQRYGGTPDAQ